MPAPTASPTGARRANVNRTGRQPTLLSGAWRSPGVRRPLRSRFRWARTVEVTGRSASTASLPGPARGARQFAPHRRVAPVTSPIQIAACNQPAPDYVRTEACQHHRTSSTSCPRTSRPWAPLQRECVRRCPQPCGIRRSRAARRPQTIKICQSSVVASNVAKATRFTDRPAADEPAS